MRSQITLRLVRVINPNFGFRGFFPCSIEEEEKFRGLSGPWVSYTRDEFIKKYQEGYNPRPELKKEERGTLESQIEIFEREREICQADIIEVLEGESIKEKQETEEGCVFVGVDEEGLAHYKI